MDLLDRLLGHDAWTTHQLLDLCVDIDDAQLDCEFDIGHRTLRMTFDHLIHNMEVWSSLMAGKDTTRSQDRTISGMLVRLDIAAARLAEVSRRIAEQGAWDKLWTDHLDDPPSEKSFGGSIAHVITHSMHHRAQILYMLRRLGLGNLPEGDVLTWEEHIKRI